MRILVAEDDREVAEYMKRGLEEESNYVRVEFDGAAALRTAQAEPFDAIVLDIMLPQMDGLEVTRRLRAASHATPILLLTARDAPRDIVRGLDAGADDYLTKPFSFEVLMARLRARTRASGTPPSNVLSYRDLSMNLDRHEARRGRLFLRPSFPCSSAWCGRPVGWSRASTSSTRFGAWTGRSRATHWMRSCGFFAPRWTPRTVLP
jgi:DNA-binding response OmpR family regulator